MQQVKVKITESYKDGQGSHIVCGGKFILIEVPIKDSLLVKHKDSFGVTAKPYGSYIEGVKGYNPIIISETEEPVNGDLVYVKGYGAIWEFKDESGFGSAPMPYWANKNNCKKILAIPENFSDKHLKAIVDGKLIDGVYILIKCAKMGLLGGEIKDDLILGYERYEVKLKGHHIKLFPVKEKLYTKNEVVDLIGDFVQMKNGLNQNIDRNKITYWLNKNNF